MSSARRKLPALSRRGPDHRPLAGRAQQGIGHLLDMLGVAQHDLDLVRHAIAVEEGLRFGKGQIDAGAVNVIASGAEDVDHLVAVDPGRGAEGGLHPLGRDDADAVADLHLQIARHPFADGNSLFKTGDVAAGAAGMGNAGDRQQVIGADAVDLDAGVAATERGHDLPLDQRRGAGHAGHRGQRRGDRVVVLDGARHLAGRRDRSGVIDRRVGVGAEDRVDEFRTESRPHGERGDQREDRQRDADQRDQGHHADAPLGAPRPEVAPGDLPFEGGEGRGAGLHGGPAAGARAKSGESGRGSRGDMLTPPCSSSCRKYSRGVRGAAAPRPWQPPPLTGCRAGKAGARGRTRGRCHTPHRRGA